LGKQKVATPPRDELAQLLAESLNNLVTEGQVAFFLDGSEQTPTDLDDFVSTGATVLDLAISNRPHGGLPVGRIVELTGLEGSGKSLICAHVLANVQKLGGVGVLIDTESAVNEEFFTAVGVDWSKLVYVNTEAIEDIFEMMSTIITKVRQSSKDRPVVIAVDSIAGASTRSELDGDYSKQGYATDKAIIISQALRKMTNLLAKQRILVIFTNQLRMKLNAPAFADPYTTSGGKSIGFHSSVRIRLTVTSKIKQGTNVIGVTVKAKVIKNRTGPPHREATFDVYFDRGIDDYDSWLKVLKESKAVKQGGAWYTYKDHKFQKKDFPKLLSNNPELKDELYQAICDHVIMSYRRTDDDREVDFEESDDS